VIYSLFLPSSMASLSLKHITSSAVRTPLISQRGAAFYLNKVTLAGKVGKDPQVFNYPSGFSVVKFPVATTSIFTNKDGEKATRTEWHQVSVTSPNLVEFAQTNVTVGAHVWLTGSISTQKWVNQEGQTRHRTEIVCRNELKVIAPGRQSENQEAPELTEEEHKQE